MIRSEKGLATWSMQVRFFFSSSLSQMGGCPSLVNLAKQRIIRCALSLIFTALTLQE